MPIVRIHWRQPVMTAAIELFSIRPLGFFYWRMSKYFQVTHGRDWS